MSTATILITYNDDDNDPSDYAASLMWDVEGVTDVAVGSDESQLVIVATEGGLVTHVGSPIPVVVIDYDAKEQHPVDEGLTDEWDNENVWLIPQDDPWRLFPEKRPAGAPEKDYATGWVGMYDPSQTDSKIARFARSVLASTECGRCGLAIRPVPNPYDPDKPTWVDRTDGDGCAGVDGTENGVHHP